MAGSFNFCPLAIFARLFDCERGGIVSIVDKTTGRELVDTKAKYAFGQYLYQRFDRKQTYDYDERCEYIDSVYGFATGWNVRADLPADIPYVEAVPTFTAMTLRKSRGSSTWNICDYSSSGGRRSNRQTSLRTSQSSARLAARR